MPLRLVPLLLVVLAAPVLAQDPPAVDTFEREALKQLRLAHENKRSVTVHVGGQAIHGLVKAIGPDVVVLASADRGTILVRRERIEVLQAD